MDVRIYAASLPGEPPWRHSHYPVRTAICSDLFDYGDGLTRLWQHGHTIVNVEHDMEFSDALVANLLECEHPLCAHAYQMHQPNDRGEPHYYAHGWLPRETGPASRGQSIRWISRGEEWADHSGLGFVKIAPEAQRYPLAENIPWQCVEQEVSAAVAGTRWHIHWPEIEHYHR